jgi:hypothetical protein
MALTGPRAHALLSGVLDRIRPHLPAGVRVEMLPHKRWTTLAQTAGSGEGLTGHSLTVRGIGAPGFFPHRTRAKLTAQHAVETVLEVAHWKPGMSGRGGEQDFDVRAVVTGDAVSVSYRLPGADPDARVELLPIPLRLL